jgi:hypothetical protein
VKLLKWWKSLFERRPTCPPPKVGEVWWLVPWLGPQRVVDVRVDLNTGQWWAKVEGSHRGQKTIWTYARADWESLGKRKLLKAAGEADGRAES